MSRLWFLTAGLPLAYFLAMLAHPGFRGQHRLARAGSPDSFKQVLDDVGGPGVARVGVWIDGGFIVLFAAVAVGLLAFTGQGWWLPLVAVAVDLVEDALLLSLLEGEPSAGVTRVLAVLALVKLLAYLVVLVAVVVAFAQTWRGP